MKIIYTFMLFFIFNCSFLHYAEDPNKKKEIYIEEFNKEVEEILNKNFLDVASEEQIKLLSQNKELPKQMYLSELIKIKYDNLIKKYKKCDKDDMKKSFAIFKEMQDFIKNSDIIRLLYKNKGHNFVYDIFTGGNLGFFGLIGGIDNHRQYKNYATQYVRGVKEYEGLRKELTSKIEGYANKILDKWEKINQVELLKSTQTKGYCEDIYNNSFYSSNLSTDLLLNLNLKTKCIYRIGYLKIIQVLKDGILVIPHDITGRQFSTSNAFIYTDKKYTDNVVIDSGHVYYVGRYNYDSLFGGKRTVASFREINKENYPFIWK